MTDILLDGGMLFSFYCKLMLKPVLIVTTNGEFLSHMPEGEGRYWFPYSV